MGTRSPIARHASSPADLKARIEAERLGRPFVLFRDEQGTQKIVALPEDRSTVTVGRRPENTIALDWDTEVSRVHAQLECVAGAWTIVDDGLSRNGSWVNGERLTATRRLRDGDLVRFGNTVVAYLQPGERESDATASAVESVPGTNLTETQRRVLIALARPFKDPSGAATPATNKEIADEVFLSVDAVKGNLRILFQKFGVQELPQNKKRAQLVWLAFRSGAISVTSLWE
jgi:pSer/pThr/pTyr-binding forkhead associated (FHA) protein